MARKIVSKLKSSSKNRQNISGEGRSKCASVESRTPTTLRQWLTWPSKSTMNQSARRNCWKEGDDREDIVVGCSMVMECCVVDD
jgi:hypothetical protein